MPTTADVVIVGGGIVGASVAYHLRADGFTGRVLVVDPDLTHARAATPASMGGVRTQYGHLHDARVRIGQNVERGEVIATLGNTGRSTGPHLHYVVEVNGRTKDPLDYIFD